ncbi:hypothetical protein ACT7C9_28240 [Bacillus cereus]
MTKEQIIEAVKSMTVLELNDLVKAIEEEFGVTVCRSCSCCWWRWRSLR